MALPWNDSLYGNFRQRKFTDIYPDLTAFKADYDRVPLPDMKVMVSEKSIETIYYLLYSYYGNSVIASYDENQFCFKLFSLIWQYAPTWQKNLEIQNALRDLTETDILQGGKAIYNHAFNPGNAPSTGSLTELDYINDQNTTNYKKSKLEGYATLAALLATDVTQEFINRFKILFMYIVEPEAPLWYGIDDDNFIKEDQYE